VPALLPTVPVKEPALLGPQDALSMIWDAAIPSFQQHLLLPSWLSKQLFSISLFCCLFVCLTSY